MDTLEESRRVNWRSLDEVQTLHIRTVAAILMWLIVILLILNNYFRSGWIFWIAIAAMIITVLVYFSPQLRKRYRPS